MRANTSLFIIILVTAAIGCDGNITGPTDDIERIEQGIAGPGSPECERIKNYILAPGDSYNTNYYRRAVRAYIRGCTGQSEQEHPNGGGDER